MHPTQDIFVRGVVFFLPLLAQKASNGDKQHPHNPLLLPLHPTSSTREGHTDEGKGGEPIDAGHSLTPRRRTKKKIYTASLFVPAFFSGGSQMQTGGNSLGRLREAMLLRAQWPGGRRAVSGGGGNKVRTASSLGGGAASDLTGPPTTSCLPAPSKVSSIPATTTTPPPEARVSSEAGNATVLDLCANTWTSICGLMARGRSAGREECHGTGSRTDDGGPV